MTEIKLPRLQERARVAKEVGVEIPSGGLLEMVQYCYECQQESNDGLTVIYEGYMTVIQSIIDTWESPETRYDFLVWSLATLVLSKQSGEFLSNGKS